MMDEDLDIGSATGPPETGGGRPPSRGHPAGSGDALRRVLGAIRDDLGFETASLFLLDPDDDVWTLVARSGPVRAWHSVLHPEVIAGLADGGVYADARQVPGVGLRLTGLGCGSILVHAVDDDACMVLDAGFPRNDRVPDPDSTLVSTLAEALGGVRRAEPSHAEAELGRIRRLLDAMARVIDSSTEVSDVLGPLAEIVGADELVVVAEGPDGPVVIRSEGDGPEALPSPVQAILRILPPSGPVPRELAERLGGSLGIRGMVRAAPCHPETRRELLVGSWEHGTTPSDDILEAAARLAGIARAATALREGTIDRYLEPERARWAHEIHDGITQAVTAAVIQIENLRELILDDPSAAAEALEGAQDEIRRSLGDLRGIMADLSETGTATQPVKPLQRMIEDVVQRWRLPAQIAVSGEVAVVPQQVLSTALVVIREALTNAAKHSGAKHVGVDVVANPTGITAVVKDNGRGFDPASVERKRVPTHLGLRLMRRRVADVGGTVEVSSAPGAGTRVIARIPISGDGGGGPTR